MAELIHVHMEQLEWLHLRVPQILEVESFNSLITRMPLMAFVLKKGH